ncbi:hypothetical protein PIB30_010380 [Stylosanthes scabra]|uniref:Uncharacterized protein n=1 Tax=Stylosanthes scabra TaxID=79078 RepID=A0ABU6W3I4_9FABA|nr:hypothetical protein [Stylosanthes scabra]
MARDGGRGRGAATRGRGRPRKNTGIPLNLDPEPPVSTCARDTDFITASSTPDTDVADEDANAAASATADTRPLLIWDGHDWWDEVKKGTTKITNVFKEHYKCYAPLFNHAPDEVIDFWWEEWHKRFRFRGGDEANMRKA